MTRLIRIRQGLCMGMFLIANSAVSFPTVCSIVNTPAFEACLGLSVTISTCGFPPRPCAHFSYNVPQTYIEVVSHPGETFFRGLPSVESQTGSLTDRAPFGVEEDSGAYSFHAHTITVPFVSASFQFLPCGGTPTENLCLSAMSEHLGSNWKTGRADLTQPQFIAWSANPKACLTFGAVTSITGNSYPTGHGSYSGCSTKLDHLERFPPSNQPVCSGWGIHFPRYGTVTNADQLTASLVIASRIKSLGSEVFHTVGSHAGETWQMIHPQPSACFMEGQNVALLRLNQVSEVGRLIRLQKKNYLYATWKRVSCTKDLNYVAQAYGALAAMRTACGGSE